MNRSQSCFFRSFILIAVLGSVAIAGTIKGLCYSPFRYSQSPTSTSPTKAQIVEDLVLIKKMYPGVTIRTFGIDKDYLRLIPAVCESLGIDYVVSGWASFSYSTWSNAYVDLKSFAKLADSLKYTHLKGIIYGYNNFPERTLYPESTTVTAIKGSMNTFKGVVAQPYKIRFSHEENWDVWIRHPELADSLDFVAIRIIPQDDMVKAGEAGDYALKCYQDVKKVFPDKEVVITSIGWSTYSSSERDQKEFLTKITADTSLSYYLFEFADETWKASSEARFGVFTENRQPKLFAYIAPPAVDFSGIFASDPKKLDGVAYKHNIFPYPSSISLTALQKNIGYWADTLDNLARYTFFDDVSATAANGTILDIFNQNGNKLGIFGFPGSGSKAKIAICSPSLYDYGSKTELGRASMLSDLRRSLSSSAYDSVFMVLSGVHPDTMKKYPEFIEYADGFNWSASFSELKNVSNKEAYVNNMISSLKEKLGSKGLVVTLDVSDLDYEKSTYIVQYRELCTVFMKAKEKHGFFLVMGDVGDYFDLTTATPSAAYKFIFPERFKSAVSNSLSAGKGSVPCLRLVSNGVAVHSPQDNTVVSFFDLGGKLIIQKKVGRSAFFSFASLGIPSGTCIIRLADGKQALTLKSAFKK